MSNRSFIAFKKRLADKYDVDYKVIDHLSMFINKDLDHKINTENELIFNLFKKPSKEKYSEMPHFINTFTKDYEHQADLLQMPNDNGYKYILVVTDIGTRISDAEPLKTKNSKEVAKAFKTIYKRGILTMPASITMDSGTEFKGHVKQYFKRKNVSIKYAKPGRHRQLALVERTNYYISKALFKRMYSQEILTQKKSVEWVDYLPIIIDIINYVRKRDPIKPPDKPLPICTKNDCNLIPIGTKVRPILDNPTEYLTKKRLHGKFRVTDMRWDPQIRIVKDILLLPNMPPLYLLNDKKDVNKVDNQVAYTKKQLQIVPENERNPIRSLIYKKRS